jgi:hypothetical protein
VETLNGFLEDRHISDEAIAELSGLTTLEGDAPKNINNKIVVTVLNIEREAAAISSSPMPLRQTNEGGYVRTPQDLALNVYVMVSASFDDRYRDGLRVLSGALGFFQSNPIITPASHPNLPKGIRQLAFKMVNLDLQTLGHVWGVLGGRYMPSALYKIRLVTIDDAWLAEMVPEITGVAVDGSDGD